MSRSCETMPSKYKEVRILRCRVGGPNAREVIPNTREEHAAAGSVKQFCEMGVEKAAGQPAQVRESREEQGGPNRQNSQKVQDSRQVRHKEAIVMPESQEEELKCSMEESIKIQRRPTKLLQKQKYNE